MYRLSYHALDSQGASRALSALPRPIVHLSGFESGLLLPGTPEPPGADVQNLQEETKQLEAEVVDLVLSSARTVVWDGQGYAPDSFTALLLRLIQLQPALMLVSFIDESHRATFSAAWSQPAVRAMKVTVFTARVSSPMDLATRSLEASKYDERFCFGGDSLVPMLTESHPIPYHLVRSHPMKIARSGCVKI